MALEIGLFSTRFWRMTPADLVEHYQIFARQQKREMERTAWAVHHIMAAFVGSQKAPTIDELLGRTQKIL